MFESKRDCELCSHTMPALSRGRCGMACVCASESRLTNSLRPPRALSLSGPIHPSISHLILFVQLALFPPPSLPPLTSLPSLSVSRSGDIQGAHERFERTSTSTGRARRRQGNFRAKWRCDSGALANMAYAPWKAPRLPPRALSLKGSDRHGVKPRSVVVTVGRRAVPSAHWCRSLLTRTRGRRWVAPSPRCAVTLLPPETLLLNGNLRRCGRL